MSDLTNRKIQPRIRRLITLAVPFALAVSGLGALGGGTAAAASGQSFAPGSPIVPTLSWQDCGDGFECANATVPLDYSRPRGSMISLALTRLPASDPAHRIGSLFINPGGPGGSGVSFAQEAAKQLFSDQVRAHFDIVGFDPRFVGESRPLATCATDAEVTELTAGLPAFPITPADELRTHRAFAQYNQLCAQRSPFLAYDATANVARDLDLLRQAVGDQKLNYVGYSYGSVLGQTYAALFPTKIRALTIDGVADAQQWSTGSPGEATRVPFTARIGSASGAYATFKQFIRLCDQAGPANCAFTGAGGARAKYDQLAASLRVKPITVPGGFVIGYPELIVATLGNLYNALSWQDLGYILGDLYAIAFPASPAARIPADAKADARGARLLQDLAEKPTAPRWLTPSVDPADPAPPLDNDQAAYESVACSDSVNPVAESAWARAGAQQDRIAPYFGRDWTWTGEPCASWMLPGKGRYLGPYNRATSAPILVIGTRYDPATPYSGAQAVARRIPGARLLTIDGYGHTSLSAPDTCAQAVLDSYLINGTTPARGTVCHQDVAPFAVS